jgi:hypothetical protein
VTERDVLARAAALAAAYVEGLGTRHVGARTTTAGCTSCSTGRSPTAPWTRSRSSRSWHATQTEVWSQWAPDAGVTPAASAFEAIAGRWVPELLGLPLQSSFAFVTGCQMAHVTCLAAARHDD